MTQKVGVSLLFDDVEFRKSVTNYLSSIERMMKETKKASTEITKSTKDLGKGTQQAAKEAESGVKQLDQTFGALGIRVPLSTAAIVAGVGAIGIAIKNVLGDSIQEFQKFEFGMREVFTLMPDLSEDAMEQMSQDILDLGVEYGRMTEETVPALYQAISAGVPRENVMDFLVTASEAARGGVATLETAVDVLTTIVNAYGEEVINAQEASDLLFTAVQGGKVTFDQLAASAFNVVPLAAALGVEFRDVTSAIAAMTKQGVPARTATTQLRQVLANLSQEGRKASIIFKEAAGVSFTEFIAQGNNLEDAMRILDAETKRMNVSAADLFGNIRAGQGALVLTGEGLNIFANEMDRSSNATGAMSEASDTVSDSLEVTKQKADAATQALKVQIGEGLKPTAEAWHELRMAVALALSGYIETGKEQQTLREESSEVTAQILELAEATDTVSNSFGDTGSSLAGVEQALNEVNSLWGVGADNTEDMAIQARALQVMLDLLQDGFRGTGHELAALALESAMTGETVDDLTHGMVDYTLKQAKVNQEVKMGTEISEEAAEILDELTDVVAKYTSKALDAKDGQKEFNKLLFGLAEEAGFGVDAMVELAESTGAYSDEQLELAEVLGEAKERAEEYRAEIKDNNMTTEQAIALLQEEFGVRLEDARAAIEQADALTKLGEEQDKEISKLPTLIELLQQSKVAMGGFFAEALENKDEAGFFTKDLEDLGEQFVTLNGRTVDQQEVLNDLRDAYEKTEEQIRDYEIGVKSATEEDDKRAEKLEELRGDLVSLDAAMQPLLDIQGEVVMVNNMAVVSQDALNDALFEAAIAAEADAATLALLAGQLGLFTDAEVEAALKAAVLQEKIGAVAAEIASGETSIGDAIDELGRFADNLDRDFEIIVETGDLDAKMLETTTDAGEFMDRLTEHKMQIEENMGLAEEEVAGNATDISTALETTRTEIMETEKEWDTKVGEMRATVSEDFPAMATIVDTETQAAMLAVNTTTAQMATATAENVGLIPPTVDTALVDAVAMAEARKSEFDLVGLNMALGMAQGVRAGKGALAAAVAEIVANALATAEATAGVESPSIYMWEIGEDFLEGFIQGMRDKQPDVDMTVEDIIGKLISITSSITGIGQSLTDRLLDSVQDPMLDQIANFDAELAAIEIEFAKLGVTVEDALSGDFIKRGIGFNSEINDLAQEYNSLLHMREFASEAWLRNEEKVLELQQQQANLNFLQDQLDLIDLLTEAGLDAGEILGGITLGLDATLPDLIAATTEVINALVDQANEALGIVSPGSGSEHMTKAGEDIMKGLGDGIEDGMTDVEDMLSDALGDISDETMLVGQTLEEFFETLELVFDSPIDALLDVADALSSAGSTFASMFEEQFLDPIQDTIDETDDTINDLIDSLTSGFDERQDELLESIQTIFDLDEDEIIDQLAGLIDFAAESGMDEVLGDLQELEAILALNLEDEDILAQLPDLIATAEEQDLTDFANTLQEIYDLQLLRNEAEAEFAAEQERILELQRQQQQLDFLQTQLDLIRSLQEAGLDPNAILEGITLGLDASLPDLIDAMNAALGALIDQAEDDLGIESPSKVFKAMGEQIGAGLTEGIDGSLMADGLGSSINELTSMLAQPISTGGMATPFSSAPIMPAQSSRVLNFNMGGVNISSEMDEVMFEARIRQVVTEAI